MTRLLRFLLLLAVVAAAACATAPPLPPPVTPTGEDRYLVDPRLGYDAAVPEDVVRRFDRVWRFVQAGDTTAARTELSSLLTRYPDHPPALLAEAALEIREGNLDRAQTLVDRAIASREGYTAARIYAAEIAVRRQLVSAAIDIYSRIAAMPGAPPVAAERLAELRQRLFDELYARARAASGQQAITLLNEALTLNPASREARILLAQQLVSGKRWDEARRILDPLINSGDVDRSDVQEMLAEIDISRGRYEEAIVRYERLARREKDPRFSRRLEQIKEEWNAANMPPQFRRALEAEAITRSDLAVLLYWRVPSIRFAQNLATPPIAIDVSEVAGRDETIRAIAIGLMSVDPVTRRVGPNVSVSAGALTRYAARVLILRGASCARSVPAEPSESARHAKILAACGVSDPTATVPSDQPVPGRVADALVQQIDRALSR